MHRFFSPDKLGGTPGESFKLTGNDAHHIINVLRKKKSDAVTVCDKDGSAFLCVIDELAPAQTIDAYSVTLLISKRIEFTESKFKKTLYQAFVKSDKMDLIVQKATELGVSEIVPAYMKRCVSVPDERSAAHKVERWNRIAYEAAKQSHRSSPPVVSAPVDFKEAVRRLKDTDVFFSCHENATVSLKHFFTNNQLHVSPEQTVTLSFTVGPEGGYDETENALLEENNIPMVSLGPLILRTETAPIAALSMILYEEM